MGSLKTVRFYDADLCVTGTCQADAEVSIRHVCDAMGVSTQGQLKKLKSCEWAVINQRFITADDGKNYEYAMISLELLPMWLGGMDPRRVKEEARPKIIRFQKECVKVLAAHFLGIGKPANGAFASAEQIERLQEQYERQQQEIDRLNALLPSAGGLLLGQPLHAIPQATVQDRLSHLGWHEASAKHRERVRRRANAWLMMRYGQTPDVSGGPGGGGPCVYYGPQISVLDEAIRREWADALRREQLRERATGPTLFTGVTG